MQAFICFYQQPQLFQQVILNYSLQIFLVEAIVHRTAGFFIRGWFAAVIIHCRRVLLVPYGTPAVAAANQSAKKILVRQFICLSYLTEYLLCLLKFRLTDHRFMAVQNDLPLGFIDPDCPRIVQALPKPVVHNHHAGIFTTLQDIPHI